MRIGLMSVALPGAADSNKGCEALTHAFLEILNEISVRYRLPIQVIMFVNLPIKRFVRSGFSVKRTFPRLFYQNLKISYSVYRMQKEKTIFLGRLKQCDCIFDFTYGDSFSDIYGESRFYSLSNIKRRILRKKIPLILGSQTIGPFQDETVRKIASEIISQSKQVFVRDELSLHYTRDISGKTPVLTTDVAFVLPYTKIEFAGDQYRIGFNPSGLLWSGGYTRNNQLMLSIDYRQYCFDVLESLLSDERNEVHLIPHVTSNDFNNPDNDLIAVQELHERFPKTVVPPRFATASDVKSYIAGLDLFIGSRMHATIAAFSSGVPVIPVSYSRKFEGLYDSLQYPYVIKATQIGTADAVTETCRWIKNPEALNQALSSSRKIAEEKTEFLIEQTYQALLSIK